MDAGTQAALRVVLNVTRHRPTPAEEHDQLLYDNDVLRREVVDLREENLRLVGEIAEANREFYRLRERVDDQEFEIEGWKNMCDEVKHRHRQIMNYQDKKICILKAKLRTKKRKSGKVQKSVKPRELKNK